MTLHIPFDNSYARLPARMFHRQTAEPVPAPRLIALNDGLARELGIDPAALKTPEGLAMMSGNCVPEGAEPLAQAYAGLQFGGWSPQLGDGRALLLGEVVGSNGRRDIQLKGSGRTPFSRNGDGRAWLGPVLREYVVSEAMHALGIPTTRSLAAVATGARVQRERAYPGAVLTRVAASHIRVGTFQYFAARQDAEALTALTNHTIARHYPDAETPLDLLRAVVKAQADLIARWMSVGFVHGVMNTDNMTVSGETIDYGPCAFLEGYHPKTVFSSIDHGGRYAYDQQPNIGAWNLAQFASCLVPLIDGDRDQVVRDVTEAVHSFADLYQAAHETLMRAKIGLATVQDGDMQLIARLLDIMAADRADFTNTFRGLADGTAADWITNRPAFDDWHAAWQARLAAEPGDPVALMRRTNPAIIPRNHQVEAMIGAAIDGDFAPFHRLHAALADPFTENTDDADLRQPATRDEAVQVTYCGT